MKDYGVMNEEQINQIRSNENCSISSIEQISPSSERLSISVCVKVTDSDIRVVQISPEVESAFPKEMSENYRIRLIYNGRIMLDPQSLSIYSKIYLELPEKAYIHAMVTPESAEEPKSTKKETCRGFDKLESSGFNVDDIHNLRFHFHAMCIYTGINKDEDEHKLDLEDQWLDGKIPEINANLYDRSIIIMKNVKII